MRRSEESFWESVLSFHHLGLHNPSQLASLGGKKLLRAELSQSPICLSIGQHVLGQKKRELSPGNLKFRLLRGIILFSYSVKNFSSHSMIESVLS